MSQAHANFFAGIPAQITYQSFTGIVDERAEKTPAAIAYTFLPDGENEEHNISYLQLRQEAVRIAALIGQHCQAGDRVLLSFNHGLDFVSAFFACMYAGVVAVPSVPPKSGRSLERLGGIIHDSGAKIILSHSALALGKRAAFFAERGCTLVQVDEATKPGKAKTTAAADHQTLAFLQYTSGSTGSPKGVMVSQGNILHNVNLIAQVFKQEKSSVILSWLPFYHDMGLIGGVLVPMFTGARAILISPVHFTQKPLRWLKAIHKYRATTSGGPNFGFELCAGIKQEELAGLDLSSWKVAFIGAEPVRPQTLQAFSDLFSNYGFQPGAFQPCYGMAETTLLISAGEAMAGFKTADIQAAEEGGIAERKKRVVVSCGRPSGFELRVISDKGLVLPEGATGEIVVAGPSVAMGYWNKQQLSDDTFGVTVEGSSLRFLKTGDLGFLKNGEVYVTGRLKDIIIVNGRNIYPQDIEAAIADNVPQAVKDSCAAFSLSLTDREELVVVTEISGAPSPEIFNKLREVVFEEFEIFPAQIVLLRRGTIPKTTSGKIQRSACKRALLDNSLVKVSEWNSNAEPAAAPAKDSGSKEVAPGGAIKARVMEILHELMGPSLVMNDNNLFTMGLNSIKLTQFMLLVNEEYETDVSVEYIFENPSIDAICSQIELQRGKGAQPVMQHAATAAHYELSPTQHGMWFDQQLKPGSNCYNIPVVVNVQRHFDKSILTETVKEIIAEQEILRSAFVVKNEKPVRVVVQDVEFSIGEIALNPGEETKNDAFLKAVHEVFNLEQPSLFRLVMLREDKSHRLLIVAHHLIADGTSLLLLGREIISRYEAKEAGKKVESSLSPMQYKDYALWLDRFLHGGFKAEAGDYWYKQLKDSTRFEVPADHQVYDRDNKAGGTVVFNIESETYGQIKSASEQNNSTVYMFMQAAFVLLLHKYTAKNEVIIGMPVSGRERTETLNMPGVFINTLLLKISIDESESGSSLLSKVKGNILQGMKYQSYPTSWLVEDLGLSKKSGSFPLTGVFFNGLNFLSADLSDRSFDLFPGNYGLDTNIDLNCYVSESGTGVSLRLDYRTAKYKKSTVERLLEAYKVILRELTEKPEQPVKSIYNKSFLKMSQEDLEKIIRLSNGTKAAYPANESIATLVEKQASRTPGNIAVVCRNKYITYSEINGRANTLAKQLSEAGVRKGDFVAMFMDKTEEIPLAMLALMKLGAPYVPMDLNWPVNRIHALLTELSPKLLLFNKAGLEIPVTDPTARIVVEFSALAIDDKNPSHGVDLDTPIYGMYTSGTTGLPKCTVNIQKGILNRLLYMNKRYGSRQEDVVLFASKYDYDACVWQMFWPMLNGGRTVIPTVGEDMDLLKLVDLIETEKVSFSDFVPSVFNVFVDYLEGNERAVKKSASLRQLLIGGEAMNAKAIKRFKELLPHVGITNTYGATEASMGTVFYELGDEVAENIPIGRPIDNVKGLLLDENMQLVPFGEPGELYLGGDCVSLGYLNAEERTKSVFIKNPVAEVDTDRLYKTGDLAIYLPDGNIKYVGRKDLQVKIRGMRMELGEIEKALVQHRKINEAVVLAAKEENDELYLVAYLGGDNTMDFAEVKDYLKQWLPDHMLPQAFLYLAEFPRIGIGKVDKKALAAMPHQKLQSKTEYEAPATPTEKKLALIWQELLKKEAGVNNDFFESGGDSLKAMQLLSRINKKLNIGMTLAELLGGPSIREQAQVIDSKQFVAYEDILPAPVKADYVLSPAQKRLWVLSKFPETGSAYNMPAVVELDGDLDTEAFEKSFQLMHERHESLRTTFIESDGIPFQVVSPAGKFTVKRSEMSDRRKLNAHINAEMLVPFDLEKGPLIRAELVKLQAGKHVLVLIMHHIVSDGWSMGVLVKELLTSYAAFAAGQATGLKPLRIQYKDYAEWQQHVSTEKALAAHRGYWLRQFEGELPVLELPTDRVRPAVKTYNGGKVTISIDSEALSGLKKITGDRKATLFMSLLSAVKALLLRYTGQRDIIVGSPHAGRDHADLEEQVGFYVNTLALRTQFEPGDSFASLIDKVRTVTLGAFEHQAYPFDRLVDELALPRNMSRNPLFDVMVILQNTGMDADYNKFLPGGQLSVSNYVGTEHVISQFDLSFFFSELKDGLQLVIDYNSDLFDRVSVERLGGHFNNLLAAAVAQPAQAIGSLDYIGSEEKQTLLSAFNDTKTAFPENATLAELFEKQAGKNPNGTALVFKNKAFTFKELDETAGRLASYLKGNYSIGNNDIVGILLERSEWMIISILAVLKAGGAYMPIDPESPAERTSYMLQDSGSKVLIDAGEIAKFVKVQAEHTVLVRAEPLSAGQLAYVIYTSGSTGQPKGCMLENRGVVNRLCWMWDKYGFNAGDVMLQKTTYTFDVSVWEMFTPLCFGIKMVLCEKEDLSMPERVAGLIAAHGITCCQFVPSVLNAFVAYLSSAGSSAPSLKSLTKVITSGEALPLETVKQWYRFSDCAIHNLYGPTEASIEVTYYETSVSDTKIPIGRPIANVQMYVIDEMQQLVPMNVPGEVCIGGIGLARGYLNRPELTAERFVPNPFRAGERIYRTGDIGRWLPDGNIEYLGRRDNQVKVRGYRIELGEIENRLQEHAAVKQAVVLAMGSGSDTYLQACVLTGAEMDPEILKDHLKTTLPAYMIPARFVFVSEIPLNSSGKADRGRLKELYKGGIEPKAFVEPRNDEEKRLAAIWCEVLKLDKVSVTQNFFSLGGNSLNATQVISRVREVFKVELPFKVLFDEPTVRRIAEMIGTLEKVSEESMVIKRVAR